MAQHCCQRVGRTFFSCGSILDSRFYRWRHFLQHRLDRGKATYTGSNVHVSSAGVPGGVVWARSFDVTSAHELNAVAIEATGHPIITGFFGSMATFGTSILTSVGSYDAFLMRLNRGRRIPGPATECARLGHSNKRKHTGLRIRIPHCGESLQLPAPQDGRSSARN